MCDDHALHTWQPRRSFEDYGKVLKLDQGSRRGKGRVYIWLCVEEERSGDDA